ncbi:hypothetical protein BBJ29_009878 [Phytophthora kernoviae]|uniref:Protein kinase domain-containing protein n=1 Tax=Phytophthora kernoviae TaxID=325452 RepID=A0A3F2RB47_9STRA|nr:hypothetical protein BBJ29_009878 [Phytophthora kernoviae]RLN51143.1 hypothetical protein BBP00_00009942 [Phytophthora kernoviae]
MALLETMKTGDLGAIEQELDHGADVNEADNTGLMWTIKNSREDIARFLLDKDAMLDLSNRSSQNALDLAQGINILPILQGYQLERQRTIMNNLPDLCAGMVELQQELNITSLQEEALKLLKYESEQHEQHYSPRMIQVLEAVQSKLLRLSGLSVPEVPNWFIPEYEVQRHLEFFVHGAFGKVHRGTWLESQVVVKCVDANSVEDKRTFRREAKIWQKARHRHIANFFGTCDQGSPWFFVCEEAANGNLKNYLYRQKKVGRSLAWRKLYEAALGFHFLHKRNIIHNDLKCNQILVSVEGVVTLTDFGLSFTSADSRLNMPPGGTVHWEALECLAKADVARTPESDVYSLGMCVVEAVTGNPPWGNHPDIAIMFQVRKRVPLPKPKEFESDEQWEFVKVLCAFDPKKRMKLPGAIRVLKKFAHQELDQDQELQNESATSFGAARFG